MFIVMLLQDFEFEQSPNQILRFPFPIVTDKGKMIGFLPVYDTREDALIDFPNAQIFEASEAK